MPPVHLEDSPRKRQRCQQNVSMNVPGYLSPAQCEHFQAVLRRVEEVDNKKWDQRVEDSSSLKWAEPIPDHIKKESPLAFLQAMNDQDTIPTSHCSLCQLMTPPGDTEHVTRGRFDVYLTELALVDSDLELFKCQRCFPTDPQALITLCSSCRESLDGQGKRSLPRACQVNMLKLPCFCRVPLCLRDLSPLEERLIARRLAMGFITKFSISHDRKVGVHHRWLKRGHITMYPNDVHGLVTDVLPHSLAKLSEYLFVFWSGHYQPTPKHMSFALQVRLDKVRAALTWLIANNSLYQDVQISEQNLAELEETVSGVPNTLIERLTFLPNSSEDLIRTSHYVSAEERGDISSHDADTTADTILNELLENDRRETEHLAGVDVPPPDGEQPPEDIEDERLTGSMLFIDTAEDGDDAVFHQMDMISEAIHADLRSEQNTTTTFNTASREHFIHVKLGSACDPREAYTVDFFPSLFPTLFPMGRGGPVHGKKNEMGRGLRYSPGTNLSLKDFGKFCLLRWGESLC